MYIDLRDPNDPLSISMAGKLTRSQKTSLVPTSDVADATRRSGIRRVVAISEKKLRANRENAKKSTGPRTPRGKVFSSMNATKYGLFARCVAGFHVLQEDPEEYQELQNQLWKHYKPIGRAQELEVESIAACWWREMRASRFETSATVNRRLLADTKFREVEDHCNELNRKDEAILVELRNAQEQHERSGHFPPDLKQKTIAIRPEMDELWQWKEACAARRVQPLERGQNFGDQQRPDLVITSAVIQSLISHLERTRKSRRVQQDELLVGWFAIPERDDLDRLARFVTMNQRKLSHAMERLERLQQSPGKWSIESPPAIVWPCDE